MGMFLAYGSYQHQVGEADISIDRVAEVNQAQVPIAVIETWTIKGTLTSQIGPTGIDAQIAALTAAYSQDGQDLILYMPDGVTRTSTTLLAANTIGGTRVVQRPSFPGGRPAERVGFCGYTIKVTAELPIVAGNILVDYHESLKFRGGVPVLGWLEPAVGLPVQQLFKQQSTFKVAQEGHATGYNWQPAIGVDVGFPIWPIAMLPDKTSIDAESPDRIGFGADLAYKNYKVAWHYEFESLTPLIGFPTPWPSNL